MNEMLEHKGFLGSIRLSEDDEVLYGRLEFIRDLVTCESADAKGLKAAFSGGGERLPGLPSGGG